MSVKRTTENELIVGLVSISDRASAGIYRDEGIPALEAWLTDAVTTPLSLHKRLIADERYVIENTLRDLVDNEGCDLVLTTGGTGPALRDVTPEATLAVATREMPGFGEQMRRISLHFVPTAILSRQVAVLREIPGHAALIINLPGQPKAISETLGGFYDDDGHVIEPGIFAAVPYCIDLIGGPYIETDPDVVKAFRPKSARKPEAAPAKEPPAAVSETPAAPQEAPQHAPQMPQADSAAAAAGHVPGFRGPEAGLTPPVQAPRAPQSAQNPAHEAPVHERRDDRPRMSPEAIARRSVQRGVPLFNERPQRPAVQPLKVFVKDSTSDGDIPCTVIWLHGMGTDAHDFEPFAQELIDFGGPAARFLFPQAPVTPITAHQGWRGTAWFDVLSMDFEGPEDERGIRAMHQKVTQVINEVLSTGQDPQRLFIGGFSQGAAMALYSGLRQTRPLAGIIALSGFLPLAQTLPAEITTAGRATPVFMAHGAFDSIVNPMVARKSADVVENCVQTLIWREYNMDHELCPDELTHIAQFMNTALEG